ncbi:MAG: hypothetical protein PHI12_07650 [Dehalococcoidales bacterium]|nr:hypothetical protein [Dehalococcoidales bacterium]
MSLDAQVQFSNKDNKARGRNGWFTPHHSLIWDSSVIEDLIFIEVSSRRPAGSEPIQLHLSREDALKFGEAIVKVAKGVQSAEVS